jgi:drug/metabolite transporter (DMT)-like permease
LGVGASALCYVTWNFAVSVLGAVKTSVYIYLIPIITIIISAIVLREKITLVALMGVLLILFGLYISGHNTKPSNS